ncbi:hypothetical protein AA12717_0399 [Gluconacetobacter sacchari DSM 12717]|uniref:Phage tail assembly protein n=2 Tax=Gluconacetobacter sacchari TaxID=92759 RepID=A0A7W4ICA4_9PROT|nr:phage tail assembly protein [Gluconacetobacter sacchari]MBB2160084.1 phage tail assembly protein [Gluconacetobacter sacchari]GBQ19930.1 hypothetical protein AA12717_0399 [Gluconacetobacter sacchari DSM 12717]
MNMDDFGAPTINYGAQAIGLDQPAADIEVQQDQRPKLPKGAAWNPDGNVVLSLRHPVTLTATGPGGDVGSVISTLSFSPLTGADVMRAQAAKGGMAGSMNGLIQASTGLVGFIGEDVLKRLDARDYLAAAAIVGVFTDPGQ